MAPRLSLHFLHPFIFFVIFKTYGNFIIDIVHVYVIVRLLILYIHVFNKTKLHCTYVATKFVLEIEFLTRFETVNWCNNDELKVVSFKFIHENRNLWSKLLFGLMMALWFLISVNISTYSPFTQSET